MKKVTHENFIKKLIEVNNHFRDDKFVLLGRYINSRDCISIGTKYGLCRMSVNRLLRGADPTTISSAIDKHDYFLKELYAKNRFYRNGDFDVVSKYINDESEIVSKNKYGLCSTSARNLKQGSSPTIMSAIDKTTYWLNYAKEKNMNFSNYTFENTIFVNSIEKLTITCGIHGDFRIKAGNFTSKNQGCSKCSKLNRVYITNSTWTNTGWDKASKKSEYFDSFKVYIIRCWNENEEFYKIGKTYRSILDRFKSEIDMPYEWYTVDLYICDSSVDATDLESALKSENKKFSYKPLINFGGHTECFTSINTEASYGKLWRKLKEFY